METMRYAIAELTHRNGTKSRVSAPPSEGQFWYCRFIDNPNVIGVKLIRNGSVELIGERAAEMKPLDRIAWYGAVAYEREATRK